MQLNHFDLFSGIGGFALAAKWAGFITVGFSEIDPFCSKILEKNFPDVFNYGDIRDLNIIPNHIHLLTGGFPCQPFSNAGKKRGKLDERYMWPEFFRIIRNNQPDWIVCENVAGLISLGLDDICTDLEGLNYSVQSFIIPACAAYAPHRRDRIFIIANSNGLRSNDGFNNRKAGSIYKNCEWDMEKVHQEWSQLIPNTWTSLKARDWLQYNCKASRGNDGVSRKLDKSRIKALGNAVVPQVVYPILKLILEIEKPLLLRNNKGF